MKGLILQADWAPRESDGETAAVEMACNAWRNPRLEWADLPDPTPDKTDVVIDVSVCGICGSDTHCIETDADDYVIFSGPADFPCTLGHEFAGTVAAVGGDVRRVRVGDLVTSEGMLYCGECPACQAGHVNQCSSLKMLGFSHPGAFAEYAMVPEKHCFNVHSIAEREGSVSRALELASLVEPLGCAQNGMFVVGPGVNPGDHVAVFGCGPIGLGAIALAQAAGASTITAFDRTKGRVALAQQMGATHAHNSRNMSIHEQTALIREATGGWGADVVVEAAGAALQTMPVIEASIAPGATVVYLGRTGERAPVMLDVLVSKAARIVGARGHAGYGIYPRIIELIASGRIDPAPMITTRTPLTEHAQAFEQSKTREDGKILLTQP